MTRKCPLQPKLIFEGISVDYRKHFTAAAAMHNSAHPQMAMASSTTWMREQHP